MLLQLSLEPRGSAGYLMRSSDSDVNIKTQEERPAVQFVVEFLKLDLRLPVTNTNVQQVKIGHGAVGTGRML